MDHLEPCPVCGYGLGFSPWKGDSASDEICPCCYMQFGYDDAAGGDANSRRDIYQRWRKSWIEQGMKWNGKSIKCPDDWNPVEQLRAIGIHLAN